MGKKQFDSPLAPTGDRIVVVRDSAEEISEGGVHLPTKALTEKTTGIVHACGPKAEGLEVGQRVVFGSYSGTEVEEEGTAWLVLSAEDVIAVVTGGRPYKRKGAS